MGWGYEIRSDLRTRDGARPGDPRRIIRTIAIRVRAYAARLVPVARTQATNLRQNAPLAISRAAKTVLHGGRFMSSRARSLRLRARERTAAPTSTAAKSVELAPEPVPGQQDRNGQDIDLALLRLAARESARGFNHPDVASELHLLGALYHDARRYNEALAFYSTALVIRQRTLGPDHSEVASTLVDLEAARRDEASEEQRAGMAAMDRPERTEVGA